MHTLVLISMTSTFEYGSVKITLLKHAGFLIEYSGRFLYIDVYDIPTADLPKADFVFVTHEHFDHCDPPSIAKIVKPDTVLVGPEVARKCLEQFSGKVKQILLVKPGQEYTIDGLKVITVPSYNVNKFRAPGKVFHPKEDGRVGYVIELGNVRIYHAGDTDVIEEMRQLEGKVDIALLPVSGVYVMTPEEAAEAVKIIKPKVAIPMHWGVVAGSRAEAEKFKKLVENITNVVILDPMFK